MSYRPQFAYPPAPDGVREESFLYAFDGSNVPNLGITVPANDQVNNIPLNFERDAEYRLRGILVQHGLNPSTLQVWFQDAFGNYLSSNTITLSTLWSGAGASPCGKVPVIFEPELVCPLGSQVQVFLTNIQAAPIAAPSFNLYGVKRFPCEVNN